MRIPQTRPSNDCRQIRLQEKIGLYILYCNWMVGFDDLQTAITSSDCQLRGSLKREDFPYCGPASTHVRTVTVKALFLSVSLSLCTFARSVIFLVLHPYFYSVCVYVYICLSNKVSLLICLSVCSQCTCVCLGPCYLLLYQESIDRCPTCITQFKLGLHLGPCFVLTDQLFIRVLSLRVLVQRLHV